MQNRACVKIKGSVDLSVIIVSFNTKALLRQCLNSLINSNFFRIDSKKNSSQLENFEIIVIDNASTDGSVEFLKGVSFKKDTPYQKIKLILNKENLGFARANNLGIRKARGDYILLLNSDTKVAKNALKKLFDFAKTKDNLGIAGPRLLNADNSFQSSTAPFYTLPVVALSLFGGDRLLRSCPPRAKKVDWVSGSCFLIKKEVIEKIGLLDEKFFMYIEETEFCYRAKKAGFEVWFYPGAEVYHLVRGSSPEGKQKAIWWIYEGLIYYYKKHFAPWQLFVLKFLLRTKAVGAGLFGVLSGNVYLKQTYSKAFRLTHRA